MIGSAVKRVLPRFSENSIMGVFRLLEIRVLQVM